MSDYGSDPGSDRGSEDCCSVLSVGEGVYDKKFVKLDKDIIYFKECVIYDHSNDRCFADFRSTGKKTNQKTKGRSKLWISLWNEFKSTQAKSLL